MTAAHKSHLARFLGTFTDTFGLGREAAAVAIVLTTVVIGFAVAWFVQSAPPDTITITTGPQGSAYQSIADKYRPILARNGVSLKVLTSKGSEDNLKRLADSSFHVDIGFVQGGVTNGVDTGKLVSLGSISYSPLLVFYRSARPMDLLSDLTGKRLAIGPVGSGTRALSLALLDVNGIQPGGVTTLLDMDAEVATKALTDGNLDAVFLMGDSASPQTMRKLLLTPDIQLMDFTQADGYTRRIHYLNKLELPRGCVDFGKDIPSHDVHLVGPTIEIIARPELHPALSDLLLEAAAEVHGRPALFQLRGEFPASQEHEFHISPDALRYYKSGKSFFYRHFPFWLASLINRILVVFVPVVLVLIPGLRLIPAAYRWRIRLLIYRWYRALLTLEREPYEELTQEKREEFLKRLDHIETEVNRMKVPASFADQFYALRANISFVRGKLTAGAPSH